ncbi:hypothetical protein DFP72DRAFT_31460 [Ephemerocybe angulata]|uniref:Uncharacterized protein n=1 Tax=Ephemerocybe angulata TaxID=980116 RepID=A0A8H6M9P5_9AGAR|nr:hypothetical protein DFP72DRAFT_31460 [Tulosesus angulatus]
MESSVNVGQREPHLGAYLNDEVYCWELVSFLVDGYVFNVPRNPFAMGSEYFVTTYLQSQDIGLITLEGVSACQFRTFLKLMFPIHSTSTTITLSKSEWLTILTLSTLWHFLDLRGLAIQHLDPQMGDPIELIVVGRAEYVPRWVMKGYEALVLKPGPIAEEESDAIGDRTAVRLYIIRYTLRDGNLNAIPGTDVNVNGLLRERFGAEVNMLEIGNRERKSAGAILREKMEAEEAVRLEMEAAQLKLLKEQEENARRIKEEEARLFCIAEEEKRERDRAEKEREAAEEEERNRKIMELQEYWDQKRKEDQLLQRELAEKARRKDERKKERAAIRMQHSHQQHRPVQEP